MSRVRPRSLFLSLPSCDIVAERRPANYCSDLAPLPTWIKDSVLGALTKDKKKINGIEIEVSLAWQSTLYITNFPEKSNDAFIRELFGQVSLSCPSGSG
jgi:RNA recognition motif-containing protein